MSLSTLFSFKSNIIADAELPDIFPLSVNQKAFVDTDTLSVYLKILTDVIERTHGIKDEVQPSLWDNCLASEAKDGLITLLSKAMTDKTDLFLVYDKGLQLLRKANQAEESTIKEDYKKAAKSAAGVFISFKNYVRTDMVKLYSAMEYSTVASLNKSTNLSKALQFKMKDMRSSVALSDSDAAKAQAKAIATALGAGKDVLMDAGDSIETSSPDLASVKESMTFLNQKRAFYLGMPASYITGEAQSGLGDSGEGETKAIERGLKIYFFSVIKPVLEALFDGKPTFKSQDFRQIGSALEAIKTFELVSDELIDLQEKRSILAKMLDLDQDKKVKAIEPINPEPAPAPVKAVPVPGSKA